MRGTPTLPLDSTALQSPACAVHRLPPADASISAASARYWPHLKYACDSPAKQAKQEVLQSIRARGNHPSMAGSEAAHSQPNPLKKGSLRSQLGAPILTATRAQLPSRAFSARALFRTSGINAQERPLQGIPHGCALSLSCLRLPRAARKAPLLSEKHMQPARRYGKFIGHATSLRVAEFQRLCILTAATGSRTWF